MGFALLHSLQATNGRPYSCLLYTSRVNRMLNYGTGSVAASVKYDLEQKSQEDENK